MITGFFANFVVLSFYILLFELRILKKET